MLRVSHGTPEIHHLIKFEGSTKYPLHRLPETRGFRFILSDGHLPQVAHDLAETIGDEDTSSHKKVTIDRLKLTRFHRTSKIPSNPGQFF
jgi:hypothetical protein